MEERAFEIARGVIRNLARARRAGSDIAEYEYRQQGRFVFETMLSNGVQTEVKLDIVDCLTAVIAARDPVRGCPVRKEIQIPSGMDPDKVAMRLLELATETALSIDYSLNGEGQS